MHDETTKQSTKVAKQPYDKPKLVTLGSIRDLTMAVARRGQDDNAKGKGADRTSV